MRLFILALALAWAPNVFGQSVPLALIEEQFEMLAYAAQPLNQDDIKYLLTSRYSSDDFYDFQQKYFTQGRKSLKEWELTFLATVMKFQTAVEELHDGKYLKSRAADAHTKFNKEKKHFNDKILALEKKWQQSIREYPVAKVKKILPEETIKRIIERLRI